MIFFLGPPSCGKGTQSLLLKKRNIFKIFSFGDHLRNLSNTDNVIGKKIKNLINLGQIIGPDLLFENIDLTIFDSKNLILDGFPRSIEQAFFFDEILKNRYQKIGCIIEFDIQEEILIERVKNRKICAYCNQSFSSQSCCYSDNYIKREDDTLSVFKTRLKNYEKQKKELINFYNNRKIKYCVLDAFGDVEVVYDRIQKILESL